ncbi:hypothetical protein [Sanguibacter sp. 25GB23B1]|uniref:hypothetical protein n=1 Tax=unclassified Sanguibacter TaxID=2645534 RepID=UPI0032AF3DFF
MRWSRRWQDDTNDIYGRVIRRFLHGDLDGRSFALVFFDLWGTQAPRKNDARSDALGCLFSLLEGLDDLDHLDDEALRGAVEDLVDIRREEES